MLESEFEYRTRNLKEGYTFKQVPEHGTGFYPVHQDSGKVCECKMEWDEEGEVLSCPVCGLDGT